MNKQEELSALLDKTILKLERFMAIMDAREQAIIAQQRLMQLCITSEPQTEKPKEEPKLSAKRKAEFDKYLTEIHYYAKTKIHHFQSGNMSPLRALAINIHTFMLNALEPSSSVSFNSRAFDNSIDVELEFTGQENYTVYPVDNSLFTEIWVCAGYPTFMTAEKELKLFLFEKAVEVLGNTDNEFVNEIKLYLKTRETE